MVTPNKVGVTTFTRPSDRDVVATRLVDAPRRLVWEAWTSPRHVPYWVLGPEGWTMPVCEIDLRPGGGGKTTMTCTILYPTREARDAALGRRSTSLLSDLIDICAPAQWASRWALGRS